VFGSQIEPHQRERCDAVPAGLPTGELRSSRRRRAA
jgi:hypothetical protein